MMLFKGDGFSFKYNEVFFLIVGREVISWEVGNSIISSNEKEVL